MILYLTNIETDLLSFSLIKDDLKDLKIDTKAVRITDEIPDISGAKVIVLKRLGNAAGFEENFNKLVEKTNKQKIDFLAISAESTIDLAYEAKSTATPKFLQLLGNYLRAGGESNLLEAFKLISNEFCSTNFHISALKASKGLQLYKANKSKNVDCLVLFYLAHLNSKNTGFVDVILNALSDEGITFASYGVYSLRDRLTQKKLSRVLKNRSPKVVLAALWATGKLSKEGWNPSLLSKYGASVIQLISSWQSFEDYQLSCHGLTAYDVVSQVVIPEFEGRIISVPVSFKEELLQEDQLSFSVYKSDIERAKKISLLAKRQIILSQLKNHDKKVAIILSAYPSKKSRLGNAVGLDSPKSLVKILNALKAEGYNVGQSNFDAQQIMNRLAIGLFYEDPSLAVQKAESFGSLDIKSYKDWFFSQDPELQNKVIEHWGDPPGDVLNDGQYFKFAGLKFGNVVVAIQPPRGFGFNPIAIYHSPDLPPTHHYLAFYLWLEQNVDCVIHLGKHGTLEWLSGKSVGLSRACFPDAALYSLPVLYPFIVNDPGEGVQAKRRTHAQIIDHLIPPLTTADSYGYLKELETLLDEHATATTMNPEKLPMIRTKIAQLITQASLDKDLEMSFNSDHEIDDIIPKIDGYLCEIKDAVIRGGLHILGEPPDGENLIDTIAAIVSVPQGDIPAIDELIEKETKKKKFLTQSEKQGYINQRRKELVKSVLFDKEAPSLNKKSVNHKTLRYVKNKLYPDLLKTSQEISSLLTGLNGSFIHPGPSGAPSRGMAHVLPTGRNFYGIDPRGVPTVLAYQVGSELAEKTIELHLAKKGSLPRSVAIVIWATAAMRTGGDDIGYAMALAGLRPVWDVASGRVKEIEIIPLKELKRPRVEVTLRISGLFRDAFLPLIEMMDEGFKRLSLTKEDPQSNPYVLSPDVYRFYGPKPGAYGSGILNAIEAKNWKTRDDLAQIYLNWSCFGYGYKAEGLYAYKELIQRLSKADVAMKNQDNREHDIFDSDDYFQDHGGLIAAIKAVSNKEPLALFGDSSKTDSLKVHPIEIEARKVIRSRVINPKWIKAMQRHGYKGAFEISATVDYIFGYGATAEIIDDWAFSEVAQNLVLNDEMKQFFTQANPWALAHICERLLEAARREIWKNPDETMLKELAETLLEAEGLIE